MKGIVLVLRILSLAFIATSLLHLIFGLGADAMVGSPVTPEMIADPSFDSQNRFYGVTFSLMGIAMLISASDLRRFLPIVYAVLGVLFVAGIGRVIAWGLHGAPSMIIIGITAVDLLMPPVLYLWIKNVMKTSK